MKINKNVKYLLLGGGYTVQRLAENLIKNEFLVTTTTAEKCKLFREQSWISEIIHTENRAELSNLFLQYPNIEVVVDSVPPLKGSSDRNLALVGVRNVCDSIATSSVRRLIYLSTTGVFGVTDGSWVNEKSPTTASHESGALRIESEKLYRDHIGEFLALRISAIYGPGRGLGTALKQKRYRGIRGHDRWSNRIHVSDLAATIKGCMDAAMIPEVLCCSDDKPSKIEEVINFYCKQFNLEPPQQINLEEAKNRGMHTLLSNQRVSNQLLKEAMLPQLKFPTYVEGSIDEMEN